MKNFINCIIILLLIVAFFKGSIIAGMSSTNYRITSTVMSGGGGSMISSYYESNSTLGQPSPLIDPLLPPQSASYDLLTGFWYTTVAGSGCLYDYIDDGDVDGTDLEEFLNAFSSSELEAFALEFGRVDCLP